MPIFGASDPVAEEDLDRLRDNLTELACLAREYTRTRSNDVSFRRDLSLQRILDGLIVLDSGV